MWHYALLSLWRNPARTGAYLIGLSLALAVFSSTLFFIDGSARQLTQRAVAPVMLDFQVRASGLQMDITTLNTTLAAQPGFIESAPFYAATVYAAQGASSQAARLFAVPPDYPQHFPHMVITAGSFTSGTVLISEPLAAFYHLHLGDHLDLAIPGASTYPVVIGGTVNLDSAEALFAPPHANGNVEGSYAITPLVVVMDAALFARNLSAPLQHAAEQSSGILYDRQIHLRLDHSALPTDPADAKQTILMMRHRIEQQVPGEISVTDLVSATLTHAANDVIAARLLFVFLGLPGMLLAAYLARYASQTLIEDQRRELALLRARGLTPRIIQVMLAWMSGFMAIGGALLGIAMGLFASAALLGSNILTQSRSLAFSLVSTLALGVILAAIGIFLPALRLLQEEIQDSRRAVRVTTQPMWLKLPLDLGLLTAGALAQWYSSTVKTTGLGEGQAVALGVYSFLGPLLIWCGATLLLIRILERLFSAHPRSWHGGLVGMVGRSLRARRTQSIGLAVLLSLTFSFALTTATFAATYETSRQAESRYLVGSDLRVTPSLTTPQTTSFSTEISSIPGVNAVTPVYASDTVRLGSQAQTVYGIDIDSFRRATTIPPSFFPNGHPQSALDALSTHPQGVLMSTELATAYGVLEGDTIRMRFPQAGLPPRELTFQVLGIFTQFPTSSQNADLIIQSTTLIAATGQTNPAFFLVRTDGQVSTNDRATTAIQHVLYDRGSSARIESATHVISQDQSSLVVLNLSGLATLDVIFGAAIVTLGLGAFLLGALIERQREIGTLQSLGASPLQVAGLFLSETGYIEGVGLIGGLVIGTVLAWQYVNFLPGIFAVITPELSIPISQLGTFLLLGLVGSTLTLGGALWHLRRIWPAEVLRER